MKHNKSLPVIVVWTKTKEKILFTFRVKVRGLVQRPLSPSHDSYEHYEHSIVYVPLTPADSHSNLF